MSESATTKAGTTSLALACIVVWVIAAASTGPLGIWLAIGGSAVALGVAVLVAGRKPRSARPPTAMTSPAPSMSHAEGTPIPTRLLAVASAFVLLRFRVNSAWLVLAGALIGLGVARL